jgi:hypothetical protein
LVVERGRKKARRDKLAKGAEGKEEAVYLEETWPLAVWQILLRRKACTCFHLNPMGSGGGILFRISVENSSS